MASPAAPVLPASSAVPYNPATGLGIIGASAAEDPQTLAFFRSLGLTNAELYAQTLSKQEANNQAYQAQLPGFQNQLQKNLTSVANAAGAGGVSNSGGALLGYNLAQQENAVTQTAARQNTATQNQDLEQQLAASLAKNQTGAMEQSLTGAANTALASNAAVNGSSTTPTTGSTRLAGNSQLT